MRALRLLTRCALRMVPRLQRYEPLRIIDEIRDNLCNEIDFRREARNIKKFVAAFADWQTVYIPGVVGDLVSEAVLVHQRSGGRRIDNPANRAEGQRLAQNFVEAFLHQIFVLGVYHGDPHPGNLFITPDGRICFHDFGLVGSLDSDTRRQLAAYTSAFVRQDADWMLDAGIALGILGGAIDRIAFRRALAEIIADFAALPLREWSLAEAFLRVARLGRAQNVFLPHHLVVLMRALFEAESVVRTLDPEFALLQSLQVEEPDVLKSALGFSGWKNSLARLESDAIMAMHDLPAVLRSWTRHMNEAGEGLGFGVRLQGLEGLEAHLDRSSNRLALALVTLGLYIAGSLLLMEHSLGPRLGGLPAFAAFAYALALWFTLRLARAIARSGRL